MSTIAGRRIKVPATRNPYTMIAVATGASHGVSWPERTERRPPITVNAAQTPATITTVMGMAYTG